MIKNERQYRLTKIRFEKFVADAALLPDSQNEEHEIHHNANKSVQSELAFEIATYEKLRDGEVASIEVRDLRELPIALIQARIAAHLTHSDLAAKLGVHEQQIQRWEAEEYFKTKLETLMMIAENLGVVVTSQVGLPLVEGRLKLLRKKLDSSGIDRSLLRKILSPESLAAITDEIPNERSVLQGLIDLAKIFKFTQGDLLSPSPLNFAHGGARFKTISGSSSRPVHAYAAYAHYVAALAVEHSSEIEANALPQSWQEFTRQLMLEDGNFELENILNLAWKCGVIVIPMSGKNSMHGAVWKINGRFIIVLKQTNSGTARWIFDLLHELAHISLGHVTEDQGVIEETEIAFDSEDPDEIAANDWAESCLFGGASDEIENACVDASGGNVKFLGRAVKEVAKQFDMSVGVVANHMAWRLSSQGTNWWGAAQNLQSNDREAREIVLQNFLKHIKFETMNSGDQALLLKAISTANNDL